MSGSDVSQYVVRQRWLTKFLSVLLRHYLPKSGIHYREDGFVRLEDIMTLPEIVTGNFQPEEVLHMLEDDSRRRLGVVCLEDCWWVRANYGHSVDLPVRALPQLVTHLSVTLLTLLPSDDLGCDQIPNLGACA
jgi:2'-phosphotransferase